PTPGLAEKGGKGLGLLLVEPVDVDGGDAAQEKGPVAGVLSGEDPLAERHSPSGHVPPGVADVELGQEQAHLPLNRRRYQLASSSPREHTVTNKPALLTGCSAVRSAGPGRSRPLWTARAGADLGGVQMVARGGRRGGRSRC